MVPKNDEPPHIPVMSTGTSETDDVDVVGRNVKERWIRSDDGLVFGSRYQGDVKGICESEWSRKKARDDGVERSGESEPAAVRHKSEIIGSELHNAEGKRREQR